MRYRCRTHASVRRDGENFKASVSTFDAFSDGRQLALELELSVHFTARTTEVLGLASAKSADAPIWKELRAIGIQPDILLCRSERPLLDDVKAKIALFCDVEPESVHRLDERLAFAPQLLAPLRSISPQPL